MRKIKFRGKRLDNGELIYGDILHYGKYEHYNRHETYIRFYTDPYKLSFSTLPVDSDSVAQLVGYDKNGKEIYSDDTVVNVYGAEIPFAAVMISYEDIGKKFTDLRLKGVTKQYAI